jgi:hypothetical protein
MGGTCNTSDGHIRFCAMEQLWMAEDIVTWIPITRQRLGKYLFPRQRMLIKVFP